MLLVTDPRGYQGIVSGLASSIRDHILLNRTVCPRGVSITQSIPGSLTSL